MGSSDVKLFFNLGCKFGGFGIFLEVRPPNLYPKKLKKLLSDAIVVSLQGLGCKAIVMEMLVTEGMGILLMIIKDYQGKQRRELDNTRNNRFNANNNH